MHKVKSRASGSLIMTKQKRKLPACGLAAKGGQASEHRDGGTKNVRHGNDTHRKGG